MIKAREKIQLILNYWSFIIVFDEIIVTIIGNPGSLAKFLVITFIADQVDLSNISIIIMK